MPGTTDLFFPRSSDTTTFQTALPAPPQTWKTPKRGKTNSNPQSMKPFLSFHVWLVYLFEHEHAAIKEVVYLTVSMYAWTYGYICLCIMHTYACSHMHTFISAYVAMSMCTYVSIHMCASVSIHVCWWMWTMCVYMCFYAFVLFLGLWVSSPIKVTYWDISSEVGTGKHEPLKGST